MKFCTSCGQSLPEESKFCSHCGVAKSPTMAGSSPGAGYTAAVVSPYADEFTLLSRMTEAQRMVFLSEKKDSTTGLLLCLFLGGIGAHQFYLGNVGLGVVYAVFFWTCIPALVAFVEMFTIKQRVNDYNRTLALKIGCQIVR